MQLRSNLRLRDLPNFNPLLSNFFSNVSYNNSDFFLAFYAHLVNYSFESKNYKNLRTVLLFIRCYQLFKILLCTVDLLDRQFFTMCNVLSSSQSLKSLNQSLFVLFFFFFVHVFR